MSNYTVLTHYDIISTRNFANTRNPKNWGESHNARSLSNVGNLSSKLAPLNWGLIIIYLICDSIHRFSRSIHLFSPTFCLNYVFIILWCKCICFDTNYRTIVVAFIQMLLAQRILDMAYFCHYHYNGHLLPFIKICNPEETCCYARAASVIINSNTGLKCWPCRGRTPSCHYHYLLHRVHQHYDFCSNIGCFSNGKRVKHYRPENYCQSSQYVYGHSFNYW